MKTSSSSREPQDSTLDYSLSCQGLRRGAGKCMRPGGTALTQRALDICTLPPGSFVADIGCGAGGTLEYLQRYGLHQLVGIDPSDDMLLEALPQTSSGQLIRGRAETLPFRDTTFNALFCECVLSILGDKVTAVRESARVLKHGGYLVLSDVFDSGPTGESSAPPEAPVARGFLSKERLFAMLSQLGFSVLLWEEHDRFFREFVARMILAGECLPGLGCGQEGPQRKETTRRRISYFLLVARKVGDGFFR